MKVVIIGCVAGGATAAARIRRLDENAEVVVFERSGHVSYANCGLPYYISGVISDSNALTLQVKGSYINVADFVFEVENDKSLRFKLDNIKMKSAGGIEVVTSFNVKDFTVLKSLQ